MDKGDSSDKEISLGLKWFAGSAIIILVGVFLSKIMGYIYRIIAARYFGPEAYGLFSIALMVSGFFIAISGMGLYEGCLRFFSIYRGKGKTENVLYLKKFVLGLGFTVSLFSGIVLFFSANWISLNVFQNGELEIFLKIFSFLIPITVLGGPFVTLLRSYDKIFEYSLTFNVIQNVSKIVALLILIYIGFKQEAIAYSYLIGALSLILFGWYFSRNILKGKNEKLSDVDKKRARTEILSYSLPLMFAGIVNLIYYWVDSFSLGYLRGAFEVGIYNSAVPIAQFLFFGSEIFMQIFLPYISKEFALKKLKLIEGVSKQISKWIFIINIPVFSLIFFFPGAALNLLFGPEYIGASTALRILTIGAFALSLSGVSTNLISMAGKSKIILINTCIASTLNLFLNFIFIQQEKILFLENSNGINGAALATAISMILVSLLVLWQSKRYTGIVPLRRKMLNIVISVLPAMLILLLIRGFVRDSLFGIGVASAIFIVLYFSGVILLKGLDMEDLKIINKIKEKVIKRSS